MRLYGLEMQVKSIVKLSNHAERKKLCLARVQMNVLSVYRFRK